jgi:hypothetical protein
MDQIVGQALATFRRMNASHKSARRSTAKSGLWTEAAE